MKVALPIGNNSPIRAHNDSKAKSYEVTIRKTISSCHRHGRCRIALGGFLRGARATSRVAGGDNNKRDAKNPECLGN